MELRALQRVLAELESWRLIRRCNKKRTEQEGIELVYRLDGDSKALARHLLVNKSTHVKNDTRRVSKMTRAPMSKMTPPHVKNDTGNKDTENKDTLRTTTHRTSSDHGDIDPSTDRHRLVGRVGDDDSQNGRLQCPERTRKGRGPSKHQGRDPDVLEEAENSGRPVSEMFPPTIQDQDEEPFQ
jgi:hypothetical protein